MSHVQLHHNRPGPEFCIFVMTLFLPRHHTPYSTLTAIRGSFHHALDDTCRALGLMPTIASTTSIPQPGKVPSSRVTASVLHMHGATCERTTRSAEWRRGFSWMTMLPCAKEPPPTHSSTQVRTSKISDHSSSNQDKVNLVDSVKQFRSVIAG